MRAVVQRVRDGTVRIDGAAQGRIGDGLLVYLGVGRGDGDTDVQYLAEKVRHLRVFQDEAGHMNLDVKQVGGSVLVISAFTVQADARRGRRPPSRAAALVRRRGAAGPRRRPLRNVLRRTYYARGVCREGCVRCHDRRRFDKRRPRLYSPGISSGVLTGDYSTMMRGTVTHLRVNVLELEPVSAEPFG